MDDKTLGAIFIGIIYPIMVFVGLVVGIFVIAYFLPDRKRTSKTSFNHKIRK